MKLFSKSVLRNQLYVERGNRTRSKFPGYALWIEGLSNFTLVHYAATQLQSGRYKCPMEWFEIESFVLNNAPVKWAVKSCTGFETLIYRCNSSSAFVISNQTSRENRTQQNEFMSPPWLYPLPLFKNTYWKLPLNYEVS